jgi:hypothetical protein
MKVERNVLRILESDTRLRLAEGSAKRHVSKRRHVKASLYCHIDHPSLAPHGGVHIINTPATCYETSGLGNGRDGWRAAAGLRRHVLSTASWGLPWNSGTRYTIRQGRPNDKTVINASSRRPDPQGRQIPLEQLAYVTVEQGPALISRDDIRRRILVQCNVRGRDLASYVADAQRAVEQQVALPTGYRITWGGQFKNLQEASRRLMIAVPVAMFLIFSLLYMAFRSGRLALLIYLNVPMAATGGVLLLWLRGMPFSISAGIGFIALFGIAVMNGVVLVEHIRDVRKSGAYIDDAVYRGAMDRLRPVLMTATTDALGFLPMALSTSAGAEVQRPLATVVIGGVLTSSLLTLVVLPAVYRWFEPDGFQGE